MGFLITDLHYFSLQDSVPFAVIGSTQIVEINGRKVRGRLYPWGIVEGGYFFQNEKLLYTKVDLSIVCNIIYKVTILPSYN